MHVGSADLELSKQQRGINVLTYSTIAGSQWDVYSNLFNGI